ncbi:MAG TPA: cyclic-phosphate processing receiver domain-containing protein [Isosphaeraceae bacterium]|nr:cyclic-phosphate processing receiver domain-containing protein [Isosphaeraceae bacterium]
MPMKIVILEDDPRRTEVMRDRLADRFNQFEHIFFDSSNEMIDYLKAHLDNVIALSLDHDLILKVDDAGNTYDPGTGRDVADYLATLRPLFPVIIHTTNHFGAVGMVSVLEEAGWQTCRVSPFGDLEWVHESWFPAIRRAILRYGTTGSTGNRRHEPEK